MKSCDQIILFATGGLFSRTLFNALLSKKIEPVAIVHPVYPPAPVENLPGVEIKHDSSAGQMAAMALELSIPVIYAPEKLEYGLPQELSRFEIDYILVACWPYLLSPVVTGVADKAALNVHPSLLPAYRGANPILEQLANGEEELGVTLHILSDGFDQGDILSQLRLAFPTGPPTKEELEARTAEAGAGLFADAIKDYTDPGWRPVKQVDMP